MWAVAITLNQARVTAAQALQSWVTALTLNQEMQQVVVQVFQPRATAPTHSWEMQQVAPGTHSHNCGHPATASAWTNSPSAQDI